MNDNDIYNRIRHLLERWYEADLSPEEERNLRELLHENESLPPDIDTDRKLFMGLSETRAEIGQMPEVFEKRITAALEKEIAGDKHENRFRQKRRFPEAILWTMAAAACVALLIIIKPENSRLAHENNTTPRDEIIDTVRTAVIEPKPALASIIPLNDEAVPSSRRQTTEKNRKKAAAVKNIRNEEKTAAMSHYKVISDNRDIDSILNTIFSRLDTKLAAETSKVSTLELNCDTELMKAQNINTLTLYGAHEEIPL